VRGGGGDDDPDPDPQEDPDDIAKVEPHYMLPAGDRRL
jgi:hypothetical protein